MQGLLKRIWQWLRQFFSQFLSDSSASRAGYLDQKTADQNPLSDTDYEFLFSQLLDGVAHGWHEGRILKYFKDLGEQGKAKLWVAWLERFGEKALASSAPNLQLAARMMRFGELAQSFQAIEPIGQSAYEIGRKLYTREAGSVVWEYEGPDKDVTDVVEVDATPATLGEMPSQLPQETAPAAPQPEVETLTLTLDELTARLQQDTQFASQLARQFGLNTTDPQAIIEAIIRQSETQGMPTEDPHDDQIDALFEQAEQQVKLGDLEGAISTWEQALAINANLPQGWHNRGSALGALGKFEEAIASFDQAIALNAQDFQSLNGKGMVLYNLGRFAEAIASWDQVIAIQANYYQAWYNRGSALEQLGRLEEAIASYQKAVEIQPDFEPAQSRLKELSPESDTTDNH